MISFLVPEESFKSNLLENIQLYFFLRKNNFQNHKGEKARSTLALEFRYTLMLYFHPHSSVSHQMPVCRRSNIEEEQRLIPSVNHEGKGPLSYFLRSIHPFLHLISHLKKGYWVSNMRQALKRKKMLNLSLISSGDAMSLIRIITQVHNPLAIVPKSKEPWNKKLFQKFSTLVSQQTWPVWFEVVYRLYSNYLNMCHIFRQLTEEY